MINIKCDLDMQFLPWNCDKKRNQHMECIPESISNYLDMDLEDVRKKCLQIIKKESAYNTDIPKRYRGVSTFRYGTMGYYRKSTIKYMKSLGLKCVKKQNPYMFLSEAYKKYGEGIYWLMWRNQFSKHSVCIKSGKFYDTTDMRLSSWNMTLKNANWFKKNGFSVSYNVPYRNFHVTGVTESIVKEIWKKGK